MNFHWPDLFETFHGWDGAGSEHGTVWSVAVYCLVVALMIAAAVLICADLPFSEMRAPH